jgi:hypothetical protein
MPSQLIRLVSGAVLIDGLLGGASLDRTCIQLPALRHAGVHPPAVICRKEDVEHRADFWYPTIAISGTTLSVAAAMKGRSDGVSRLSSAGLIAAAVLAAGGLLATIGAAPNRLRVRRAGGEPDEPRRSSERFDFWQGIRGPLQGLAFAANVLSLVSLLAEE